MEAIGNGPRGNRVLTLSDGRRRPKTTATSSTERTGHVRNTLPRFSSLPLRVKVLSAVALSCDEAAVELDEVRCEPEDVPGRVIAGFGVVHGNAEPGFPQRLQRPLDCVVIPTAECLLAASVALPMSDAGTRVTLDVHGSAHRAAMRTREGRPG
jgi:hypothetical protein